MTSRLLSLASLWPQFALLENQHRASVDALLQEVDPQDCTVGSDPKGLIGSNAGWVCRVDNVHLAPETFSSTWEPLSYTRLTALLGSNERPRKLYEALQAWTENDPDGIASISIPSRDTSLVRPLLHLGWQAINVLAVRKDLSDLAETVTHPNVREMRTADEVKNVVDMWLALIDSEHRFGAVTPRAGTLSGICGSVQECIDSKSSICLYVTVNGHPVGFIKFSFDNSVSWLRSKLKADRPLYVDALWVDEKYRGRGLGAKMVASALTYASDLNASPIVLHHSPLNPFAVPFWGRAHFRPLLTTWRNHIDN